MFKKEENLQPKIS